MHGATWTCIACSLALALGCGPGDSPPPDPVTVAGGQPSADGPVPAVKPAPGSTTQGAGQPAAGEPQPSGRKGSEGRCRHSPGEPDWEIRRGAQGHREDGRRVGELPELVRVPCAAPTIAGGRGCFESSDVGGLETDAERVCFDEADVVEIYRDESRRHLPPLQVTMGEPVVKGPFPAGAISRMVVGQQEPMLWCVSKQAAPGIDLDDRFEVSFALVPRNSRVQDVKVDSRVLSQEVRECMARRLENLRIPSGDAKRDTRVSAVVEIETFVTEARREAAEPSR